MSRDAGTGIFCRIQPNVIGPFKNKASRFRLGGLLNYAFCSHPFIINKNIKDIDTVPRKARRSRLNLVQNLRDL
jgi:hypothetical protein